MADDNYPPYIFRDSAGRLQGILKDAWALWEARTGVKVELRAMDWARAQQVIQAGEADVIDTIFVTEPRKRLYDFSAPYATLEVPIFFHRDLGGAVNLHSLKGFAIGVKDGDACIDVLSARGIDSLKRFPNYEAVIGAAAAGEVRVFCVDKPPAQYLLHRLGIEEQFRQSVPLYVGHFHRAVRRGDGALLRLVEDGFARITPAEAREIDERWFGLPVDGSSAGPVARYGAYTAIAALAMALILAVWNAALRRMVTARTSELSRSLAELHEAKRTEEFARANLTATLRAIPDLLFELDANGRYCDFQAGREGLLAAPPELFLGRTVREILPDEAAATCLQALQDASVHGSSFGAQFVLDVPDGQRWFELSVARKSTAPAEPERFIVLSRDITDRRRAEAELERHRDHLEVLVAERSRELVAARDTAERASRAKSEFLSRMSHEFRTPLNAILGFSQLLTLDARLPAPLQEFAKHTHRAGQHLLSLISDVLDLASVESGRVVLTPEAVLLEELIRETMILVQPQARQRDVALDIGELEGLRVHADRLRLKQVLLNLLSNAVKYNRPGGRIDCQAAVHDGERVRVIVSDTGIGIDPARAGELFQPFHRLGVEAGKIEGTGIGLAISRALVEQMGGAIGVESRPGQGARFWIDLPPAATTPGAAGAAEASSQAPDHGAATKAGGSVLYVEDNPANVELIKAILTRHAGIVLFTAESAADGAAIAREKKPDLLLIDIGLPDEDGYALLARLRADPATRRLPAFAVTASASADDRARAREAGFDGFVSKPIDIASFDQLIAAQFSRCTRESEEAEEAIA